MNKRVKLTGWLGAVALALTTGQLHAQFDQVSAGAASPSLNSKLLFANGGSYASTSGYSHLLVYTIVTNFSVTNIVYSTTNLQFFCLSKTNAGGPAMGSYVVAEVLSVTGPVGGTLSFWEQGWRTPTYHFPVGVPPVVNSNRFDVSDISSTAGLADGDPVGRIPTRRFTANKAGDYFLTVKLLDLSTNTSLAGPVHTESDPLTIKFTTGLDMGFSRFVVSTNNVTNRVTTITFRQSGLTNMFLDATTDLSNWVAIRGPFTSAPALHQTTAFAFTNRPPTNAVFYRLRGTPQTL
jgi:hypothetical protein